MRHSRTVSAYLVREVLGWAALGLLAVALVFVSQNLVRMLDKLLAIGVEWSDVVTVAQFILLALLAYMIPIAFVFGLLVAIGRMAGDSEILALRTCGFGLRQLALPVLALAGVVSCATAWLMIDVEPRARRELREAVIAMTTHGSMIEQGEFKRMGERVVYVRSRDEHDRLAGVLISDRSDPARPFMIFAESGVFDWNAETGEASFRLRNGDIHVEPADANDPAYRRIVFDDFEYSFPVANLLELETAQTRPKDMTIAELRASIAKLEAGERVSGASRNPNEYRLQIHRRVALPFAPLLFALVGVPLAARRTRGGRSWGVLLCVGLVGAYYGVLTFSSYLALGGALPPGVALWIPNALCAVAGVWLLVRARRPGA